jgi:DNA invertase Pin-like site-specific DNA recombinase
MVEDEVEGAIDGGVEVIEFAAGVFGQDGVVSEWLEGSSAEWGIDALEELEEQHADAHALWAQVVALRQRAIALGWPAEQIIVIDCDQGQSGASAADRAGFQQLVAEVGLGHAGIVLGLEVSRLARSSTDWHQLLELCALSQTLILDEDGLYDPGHFNDRLLLRLKGTMSEALSERSDNAQLSCI